MAEKGSLWRGLRPLRTSPLLSAPEERLREGGEEQDVEVSSLSKGKAVLTGEHFMMGDVACAEGALAAGCRFFGGYPITPSTETAEHMAARLPEVGGFYVQMEDELGSIAAVLGASWGGLKAMTATSGPGFSLMMLSLIHI